MAECPTCKIQEQRWGRGAVMCPQCEGRGVRDYGMFCGGVRSCEHCGGSGAVKCGNCRGTGEVR